MPAFNDCQKSRTCCFISTPFQKQSIFLAVFRPKIRSDGKRLDGYLPCSVAAFAYTDVCRAINKFVQRQIWFFKYSGPICNIVVGYFPRKPCSKKISGVAYILICAEKSRTA